ncbi:MAG: hypothetical protein M3N50_08045, partial [Pseudomonadota bacterium]|nr:hypothetical protein [Pseudomonadota bacterium]
MKSKTILKVAAVATILTIASPVYAGLLGGVTGGLGGNVAGGLTGIGGANGIGGMGTFGSQGTLNGSLDSPITNP